jgi:hypothetical protein
MEEEENNIKMIKTKYYDNTENKIYISLKRKSKNINQFYYKRVKELINEKKYKEIYICGIGACVNEAIKISLFITELIPNLKIEEIKTSTVNHFDEYIDINTKKRIGTTNDRKSNLISIKLINTN